MRVTAKKIVVPCVVVLLLFVVAGAGAFIAKGSRSVGEIRLVEDPAVRLAKSKAAFKERESSHLGGMNWGDWYYAEDFFERLHKAWEENPGIIGKVELREYTVPPHLRWRHVTAIRESGTTYGDILSDNDPSCPTYRELFEAYRKVSDYDKKEKIILALPRNK